MIVLGLLHGHTYAHAHIRIVCTYTAIRWVDAIIRMAIMRHLMGGTAVDASDALQLFLSDMQTPGHLPACALTDGTAFRTACCYIQPVDEILSKYEPSLRACLPSTPTIPTRVPFAQTTHSSLRPGWR